MGIELFVSPDGNDIALGTMAAPLRTLIGVQNRLRTIYDGKTPIMVYFRGGIYTLAENSTVFTSEDCAEKTAPITFKAYGHETPYFEGGIKINMAKAEAVKDEKIKSRIIDEYAREHLHKIDISEYIELMPTPFEQDKKGTAMLFMDGEPMRFARWPSKKYANRPTDEAWLFAPNIIHGVPARETPFELCTDYSVIDHIKRFWSEESLNNAWLAGYLFHNWSYGVYSVQGVNAERNSVIAKLTDGSLPYLCDPEPCFKYRRYYFYNVFEELSEPLEYYIDYEEKALYCCLESTAVDLRLITKNEPVFTFNNADNITLDGFAFAYSSQRFIYGNHSENITVKNCRFSRGAEDAVDFCGCNGLKFLNNNIYYMGSGGILAYGAGNMKTLTSGNILIESNDIHDVSIKKRCGSCAVNLWSSVGTQVRHNRLHGSPHMLLFIGGIDTVVEYNEIYDAALDTDDASAVYWGRTATTIGTRIRYNYFHDIGHNSTGTWSIGAVYMDDNATGAEIYGNLFIHAAIFGDDDMYKLNCRQNAVVCLNAAQFVHVHDNIMVMSTTRDVPMSDTCRRDMIEWIKGSIGAYIPGNTKTRGMSTQWREQLTGIGFYGSSDGIAPSELWKEHYKNTLWEDMFELLSYENYIAGVTNEQGNSYGIPDIRAKFERGEIDEEQAKELFDKYVRTLADKYGESYFTDKFDRNIIIGMNSELLNENGVFKFNNTPNNNNMYITAEQAKKYFSDPENVDYSLTEEGKKVIYAAIPDFSCLE